FGSMGTNTSATTHVNHTLSPRAVHRGIASNPTGCASRDAMAFEQNLCNPLAASDTALRRRSARLVQQRVILSHPMPFEGSPFHARRTSVRWGVVPPFQGGRRPGGRVPRVRCCDLGLRCATLAG